MLADEVLPDELSNGLIMGIWFIGFDLITVSVTEQYKNKKYVLSGKKFITLNFEKNYRYAQL